jgi:hypothetical protein
MVGAQQYSSAKYTATGHLPSPDPTGVDGLNRLANCAFPQFAVDPMLHVAIPRRQPHLLTGVDGVEASWATPSGTSRR